MAVEPGEDIVRRQKNPGITHSVVNKGKIEDKGYTVHHSHSCSAWGGQKRASDILSPELSQVLSRTTSAPTAEPSSRSIPVPHASIQFLPSQMSTDLSNDL